MLTNVIMINMTMVVIMTMVVMTTMVVMVTKVAIVTMMAMVVMEAMAMVVLEPDLGVQGEGVEAHGADVVDVGGLHSGGLSEQLQPNS